MNENDNNDIDDILVDEPEQEIGKLKDIKPGESVTEDEQDGLSTLVRSVYPYAVGLIGSMFLEMPGSLSQTTLAMGIASRIKIDEMLGKIGKTKADTLRDDYGYPDDIVEMQKRLDEDSPLFGTLFFVLLTLYNSIIKVFGKHTIIKSRLLQDANKDIPVQIPDTNVLFQALLKDTNYSDEAHDFLDRLGLNNNAQQLFWDAIKQIPSIDFLFQNLWRGKIKEEDVNKYLAKMGFDKEEQTIITNITERIPPIQDIIRFAVREAFSEELSLKYQHDFEFPPEVADWSEKQGFSKDWALKYWRAHWELPSVQMVFEMLHREVIKPDGTIFNKDDMNDLLRMADYPVFWRDLLTQISYKVITRVDARRMYKLGVWDNLPNVTPEEKVLETYRHQGYNAIDAEYMTDFTVEFTADQRKALTVAGLKKIRKYGIITEQVYIEKLTALHVHPEEISLLVQEVNYELEDKKLDSFMNYAKQMYLNGRWSKSDIEIEMSKIGLHISEPDNLFESWDYDKHAKRRVLRMQDITRLLGKGIIPHYETAISELMDLGYDKDRSTWLVMEVITDLESDIATLYKIGFITNISAAIKLFTDKGMSPSDASNFVTDKWHEWTGE